MSADGEVKAEVLRYLEGKGKLPGATEADKLRYEYLSAGLIDSLGIVEMVEEFERRFGVRFRPEDLQSQDFQTVGGLIGLIERLPR